MVGRGGERHWSRADFSLIQPGKRYNGIDAFTDEQGNPSPDMPQMKWQVALAPEGEGTKVTVTLGFESEADMKKIIETGFEEGFAAGHDNLDELLKKMAA